MVKSSLIGYLTDPHGKIKVFNKFFELCQQKRVKAAILGGDLTPKFPLLKLADGTRIPVQPVLSSRDHAVNTVSHGLEKVRNSQIDDDGLYEFPVKDPKINFERLYKEQVILDKLHAALEPAADKKTVFSDEELVFIEKHLLPLIQELEQDKTFKINSIIGKIRNCVPCAKSFSDKELRLSANLIKGLRSIFEIDLLVKSGKKQLALKCLAAKEIVSFYSPSLLSAITQKSLFFELEEKSRNYAYVAQSQRNFLEKYLLPRIEQMSKDHVKTFIQFGNDDIKDNEDLLTAADASGILGYINQRALNLDNNFRIAGYSFVNPIPGVEYSAWQKSEEEIGRDIEVLFNQSDPQKTVYVFHAPPFGTCLDQNGSREHIGSISVRAAIQKLNPYLLLTGHAHASRIISGKFYEKIGMTHAFQPGGIHASAYGGADILFIDLLNPAKHWHTASGPAALVKS